MKVDELKKILAEIEEIYAEGGAKKAAEDFAELQTVFEGYEDTSVSDFVDQLRSLYAPKKKANLRLVEQIDELVVERYLKRLSSLDKSGCDDEELINSLLADSSVKKAEANLIQHRFLGGRERWPSKKSAVDAIRKRLAHRLREAHQLNRIKDVTPW